MAETRFLRFLVGERKTAGEPNPIVLFLADMA